MTVTERAAGSGGPGGEVTAGRHEGRGREGSDVAVIREKTDGGILGREKAGRQQELTGLIEWGSSGKRRRERR